MIGGLDSSGEKIYVGRVKKDGIILPGKVVPSHKSCYVAHNGAELGSSKFQVFILYIKSLSIIACTNTIK